MEGCTFQIFASPSTVHRDFVPSSTFASGSVLTIIQKYTPKEVSKRALGRPSGALGSPGASWGSLGVSWGLLGCLGASPACENTYESASWASPTCENTYDSAPGIENRPKMLPNRGPNTTSHQSEPTERTDCKRDLALLQRGRAKRTQRNGSRTILRSNCFALCSRSCSTDRGQGDGGQGTQRSQVHLRERATALAIGNPTWPTTNTGHKGTLASGTPEDT
jgi:hypothetical protein